MKKLLIFCILTAINTELSAQSLLDQEIDKLVKELVNEVHSKMKGKNIAITDFIDNNDKPSELGQYLSEEFSYALVNAATDFKVIDRSQLRKLLDEAGIGDKGMVDAQSVQKLGKLKGISAVVYGKLFPLGNQVKIFVKVIVLEELVNEITVRGDITRTPTIERLLEFQNKTSDNISKSEVNKNGTTTTTTPFINQNIQIILSGCTDKGNGTIDCDLQITSIGRDDNFSMQTSDTNLSDAQGRNYRAQSMSMNNRTSVVQVNQPLQADTPSAASIRFTSVPTDTRLFNMLSINCRSFSAYSFVAKLNNITVK